MRIRIGTRGSKLALWQANHVKDLLLESGHDSELVIIETLGDQIQNIPLNEIGGRGLFTKALDDALLEERIDIAVHSAKDLPGKLHDAISLAAILKREDPRDVLLAMTPEVHFENLSRSFRIGTSSLRRGAFIRHYFPTVEVLNLRGNLDTRIRKLETGEYDGIMLAYAGVKRLGMERYVVQKLAPETFTPAAGQGAVAITCLGKENKMQAISQNLTHAGTQIAVESERSYLSTMEGGCNLPVFAHARVFGETVHLMAGIASTDGSQVLRHQTEGPIGQASQLGIQLATMILQMGGEAIRNGIQN